MLIFFESHKSIKNYLKSNKKIYKHKIKIKLKKIKLTELQSILKKKRNRQRNQNQSYRMNVQDYLTLQLEVKIIKS